MNLSQQNYFDVNNVSPGVLAFKTPRKRLNNKKSNKNTVTLDDQTVSERRERNRLAAQTCRQRKQMYIKSLEEHISKLEKCLDFFKCLHIEDVSCSTVSHDPSICAFPNSPLTLLQLNSIAIKSDDDADQKNCQAEEFSRRANDHVKIDLSLNSDMLASSIHEIGILTEKFNTQSNCNDNNNDEDYEEYWIDVEEEEEEEDV